ARDLSICRLSRLAQRVLNISTTDVVRPITQIKPNISCPDLESLILEVIDTVSIKHREVQDANGHAWSLTIRPYKNIDNRIDGAVLALFDVHEARRHQNEAQAARDYAAAILDAIPE